MKQAILIIFTMMLLGSGLAFTDQPQRVYVVRDDDGTADEGRGHVTGPRSVCRKTLVLDRDPADITAAFIMYYMKHNPYDVGTRKLYGAPAEGVEWTNFVVTLNGHEVLRESLINHGTEGWHELPVDPALLLRGENTVTMTLDGHGSYFYLGIDRSAPRGRSASSVDGGQTFRPNWLSFNTEEADSGEYMVRLKYQAPQPPEVGFITMDGHHYGWLEVEDLFSQHRPHESGFRALRWDRGVNQPSGELVAYTMGGSFETPFDIPADGQWRVWLRGWVDGFRGGAFTLTWNGELFYSSEGRHEFSSDAQLRFDWLDLGAIELAQGENILGISTAENCGHMFDVLVLTTDPAYRPDEANPLPRMTQIARLTPPEGLADVEPGLYMTESPIPWGRPLAGGALRTLWVCGGINEREIVELQQRMDLDADAISSDVVYYGKSIFGSDLNMDQADLLYDMLVSDKPYDVMVLVRTKLDQIPEHAMEELLRRVREGMGLIVVRSRREDEAPTRLSALFEDLQPLDLPGFNAPFDLNLQVRAAEGAYGDGRILVKPYCGWGMMDHLRQPPTELRFPFWEYQFGHWVKLLQYAAQRTTARLAELSMPQEAAPGEQVELTVTAEGDGGTHLAGVVWAPHQPAWQSWGPVPCAGGATVPLPAGTEDGLYHVQANLLNAAGEVVDSAVTYYRVTQAVRIADVQAEYAAEGGQVAVTLQTANAGAAAQLPVRLEVWGARGRLLGEVTIACDFAAGEGETHLHVPVMPSWERLLEVRIAVGPQGETPLQRAFCRFLRPQDVVLDDYVAFAGLHQNREAPTYLWPVYSRLHDNLGLTVDYPGVVFDASLERGTATAVIYRLTDVGTSSTGPDGERIPCLHDPEMWAEEEEKIRSLARRFGRTSPLVLGLGDEMGISHYDEVCFSPHTLGAFREHLQATYGSLNELNTTWQTDFATWDAVMPWQVQEARQRPENIAPWLEFRLFMMRTLVDTMVKMQQWVKEEVPTAKTGGANPLDESYKSCAIFSQIYPALEYAQIYPRFHDRARSWFRDPRLTGLWSGYGYDRATLELHAWLLPAYGGTVMSWYGVVRELDYRTHTNTLNLGEPGKAIRDANRELQSGIGKLLITAEVEQEPVAILTAYSSKFAYTALKASKSPQISATGWDQEFDEFFQGYRALLRSLRVPYRFIDEDQLARGELDSYRMLIAPQAAVLSDAAVQQLADFARRHPVITDTALGTYDERGRLRAAAPFDLENPGELKLHDFGDRPLRLTDENLARLQQVVAAAQVTPTREVDGDGIDFIVRKQLGDMRMLVVFSRGELRVTPPDGMVAYDARNHTLLGTGPATLTQQRSPAVVVFAPRAMEGLQMSATPAVGRGERATFDIRVEPACTTVVRLEAVGPDGERRPWYDVNVTVEGGRGSASFTPVLNDAAGEWTFTATEIISGTQVTAAVVVN